MFVLKQFVCSKPFPTTLRHEYSFFHLGMFTDRAKVRVCLRQRVRQAPGAREFELDLGNTTRQERKKGGGEREREEGGREGGMEEGERRKRGREGVKREVHCGTSLGPSRARSSLPSLWFELRYNQTKGY